MNNFIYYTPTKVFFGRDADKDVGSVIKQLGATRVLIIYGGGSVVRSGLLRKVSNSIGAAGLSYIEKGGVEPNPKVSFVRDCVALCKSEKIDFVLAVGGASVLDTAKISAISAATDIDPWDLVSGKKIPDTRIPFGVVLTIAAAGSEMSNSAVLSDPETCIKRGLTSDLNRPVVAFLNPENTYSVSKFQTGCGIVDTMMHTFERYFTDDIDNDLTERIAEGLLVSVKNAGSIAIVEPENYEARATLLWASSLSHNGLTGCGKKPFGFSVHQISHGISGKFDRVAHGAALSVLFPAWMKFVYKYNIPLFARFAVNVWGIEMNYDHAEITAQAGIDAMKTYFRSLDMPVTMRDLDISSDYYDDIAELTTYNGTRKVHSFVPLGKEEIIEILKLAE